MGDIHRHTFRAFKAQKFGQPALFNGFAIKIDRRHRIIDPGDALHHPPGQTTPQERVFVQKRRQHGKGFVFRQVWRRHVIQNQFQQRREVLARISQITDTPAITARSVKNREIQLVIIGIKRDKQIKDFIDHGFGAGVRAVNFIDDDNRL